MHDFDETIIYLKSLADHYTFRNEEYSDDLEG